MPKLVLERRKQQQSRHSRRSLRQRREKPKRLQQSPRRSERTLWRPRSRPNLLRKRMKLSEPGLQKKLQQLRPSSKPSRRKKLAMTWNKTETRLRVI